MFVVSSVGHRLGEAPQDERGHFREWCLEGAAIFFLRKTSWYGNQEVQQAY